MIKAYWPGSHVFKVATGPFKSGVPDLYATIPGFNPMWIELKAIETNNLEKFPLNLSALQRRFIQKEQLAGGTAGWLILAISSIVGSRYSLMVAGNNYEAIYAGTNYPGYYSFGRSYVRDKAEMKLILSHYCKKNDENISI